MSGWQPQGEWVGDASAEFPFGVGTTAEFVIRGTPRPQGSFKGLVSKSTGQVILKPAGRYVEWRNLMVTQMADSVAAGKTSPFPSGPLELEAVFVLARPKGHPKRRVELDQGVVYNGADIDKLVRAVCDALTVSGVIGDDTQISRLTAAKAYPGSELAAEMGHSAGLSEGVSIRLRRLPGGYLPGQPHV